MSPYDKDLIRRRFALHLEQYNRQSTVQMGICHKMGKLMEKYVDADVVANKNGYEVGAGTGFLTGILLNMYPKTSWLVNDLVEQTRSYLNNIAINSEAVKINISFFDAETAKLDDKFALVASSSVVQWFDSLEQYIKKISNNIEQGGYFVFSTFGVDNFIQIKSFTGESPIVYHSMETIERWAEETGFDVIYSEQYYSDMQFSSPHDAVRFIKETGINANSKKRWTKSEFEDFCSKYSDKYEENGVVPLSFNPMIFVLRKR